MEKLPTPNAKSLTKWLEKLGFRGRIDTIHTTALFKRTAKRNTEEGAGVVKKLAVTLSRIVGKLENRNGTTL